MVKFVDVGVLYFFLVWPEQPPVAIRFGFFNFLFWQSSGNLQVELLLGDGTLTITTLSVRMPDHHGDYVRSRRADGDRAYI